MSSSRTAGRQGRACPPAHLPLDTIEEYEITSNNKGPFAHSYSRNASQSPLLLQEVIIQPEHLHISRLPQHPQVGCDTLGLKAVRMIRSSYLQPHNAQDVIEYLGSLRSKPVPTLDFIYLNYVDVRLSSLSIVHLQWIEHQGKSVQHGCGPKGEGAVCMTHCHMM